MSDNSWISEYTRLEWNTKTTPGPMSHMRFSLSNLLHLYELTLDKLSRSWDQYMKWVITREITFHIKKDYLSWNKGTNTPVFTVAGRPKRQLKSNHQPDFTLWLPVSQPTDQLREQNQWCNLSQWQDEKVKRGKKWLAVHLDTNRSIYSGDPLSRRSLSCGFG